MPLFLFLESERKRQNYVFLLVLKDFCKKKKVVKDYNLLSALKAPKKSLQPSKVLVVTNLNEMTCKSVHSNIIFTGVIWFFFLSKNKVEY